MIKRRVRTRRAFLNCFLRARVMHLFAGHSGIAKIYELLRKTLFLDSSFVFINKAVQN